MLRSASNLTDFRAKRNDRRWACVWNRVWEGGQGDICLPAAVRNSSCRAPPPRTGQRVINALDAEPLEVCSELGTSGTARPLP